MSGAATLASGAAALTVLALASAVRSGPPASWPSTGPEGRRAGPSSGAGLRRRLGRSAGPGSLGSARASAAIVSAVAAGVAGLVIGPGPAAVLAVGLVMVRARLIRAAARRRVSALDAEVPELVDLFVLAASAGHPIHGCLRLVAPRSPGPTRAPVERAVTRVDRGVPLGEALGSLGGELGSLGRALTDALAAGARTGAPLVPALTTVAATARDHRRRTAEMAARRLPVTLLFPLVCCVLPAFALLAVVPLLAASLGSFRT